MKKIISGILISCCGMTLLFCSGKKTTTEETAFTKQDSVTDLYLAYQDSMLQSWNVMINDDNQKLKSMENLLHELQISNPGQKEQFDAFNNRLEQLWHMRYNQKSLGDPGVVEEYDFASNSLVSELLTLAEAQKEFAYNATLQAIAEDIRMADQRVMNYREDYDAIVTHYNRFIDRNKNFMTEINPNTMPEKKPLFQMVSDEE